MSGDKKGSNPRGYSPCFLLLALILGIVLPPAAADGMMFRADARHTGVYTGSGAGADTVTYWQIATGNKIISSPAVADGVLYTGSDDNYLYAFDAASGVKKWTFGTGGNVKTSPVVSEGTVYIGSYDNNTYAIDAATGMEKWRFRVGGHPFSSPAVSNGMVFIGSEDRNLYAIDAVTGTEKWRFATGGDVDSSPAVSNGIVYVGSYDNNTYAVDAVTGALKWQYATGAAVLSSPAVSSGVVYIGSNDGSLYALDAATGKKRWAFRTGGGVFSSPSLSGGVVYVGSRDGNLYAIDAVTGKEKWRFRTEGPIDISSPAISYGLVYIGSYDNCLYAVDAVTGKMMWRFVTDNDVVSTPVISNGIVYFGSLDFSLYAIDALTGRGNGANFHWTLAHLAILLGLLIGGGYFILQKKIPPFPPGRKIPKTIIAGYLISGWPSFLLVGTGFSDRLAGSYGALSLVSALCILVKKPRFLTPIFFINILIMMGTYLTNFSSPDSLNTIDVFLVSFGIFFLPFLVTSAALLSVRKKADVSPSGTDPFVARLGSAGEEARGLFVYGTPVRNLLSLSREYEDEGNRTKAESVLETAEAAASAMKNCELELAQWKRQGYDTTSLEAMGSVGVQQIEEEFRKFRKHVGGPDQTPSDSGKRDQDRPQDIPHKEAPPAPPGTRELIFISAKSEDYQYAHSVYKFLTGRGYNVFFSDESLPLLGSADFGDEIDAALEKARHFIVVTSKKENVMSKWVRSECRIFLNEKRAGRKPGNIITLLAGRMRIDDLPIGLRSYEVKYLDDPRTLEQVLRYLT